MSYICSKPTEFYQSSNHLIRQMPGISLWKSPELTLLSANETTVRLIGFQNVEDVIGITDYDARFQSSEHADVFRHQDRMTLAGYPSESIDVMCYADQSEAIPYSCLGNRYDKDHYIKG